MWNRWNELRYETGVHILILKSILAIHNELLYYSNGVSLHVHSTRICGFGYVNDLFWRHESEWGWVIVFIFLIKINLIVVFQYAHYLETRGDVVATRAVYKRAASIHCPKKSTIHLAQSAFEEKNGNVIGDDDDNDYYLAVIDFIILPLSSSWYILINRSTKHLLPFEQSTSWMQLAFIYSKYYSFEHFLSAEI